jgi:serine/threonine protein kinase
VKAYRNGDLSFATTLRIKSNLKIKDLARDIEDKLGITAPKDFRFFNQEGLELFPEDLQYLKNGATIFISKGIFFRSFFKGIGEDYDASSGLSEYEILQKLGEGGFGEVDLAVHKETGEKVAIKFLKAAMVGMNSETHFEI